MAKGDFSRFLSNMKKIAIDNLDIILCVGLPLTFTGGAFLVKAKQSHDLLKFEKEMEDRKSREIYDRKNGYYIICNRPLTNEDKIAIDEGRRKSYGTVSVTTMANDLHLLDPED